MTTMNGQRHDRTALVLYGSETGNSQDIAEELGRLTERLHFSTTVADLDATGLNELLKPTIVIFAISTTGQGDVPANAKKFWKSLLRKRLPPGCLSHVQFTTFGLGDSSYPKFNWAARKLHKRLEQLGAKEIYPRGEADEQHEDGNDGAFLPWSIDFRKNLLEKFPLLEGVIPIPDDVLLPPRWELDVAGNTSESNPDPKDASTPQEFYLPIPNSHLAVLDSNIRVTAPGHWQDVREFTFTVPSKVEYSPGDILSIYPQNHPSDVSEILELMEWQPHAHKPVQFVSTTDPSSISQPALPHLLPTPDLTLQVLLTHYFDITAIPTRYFFFQLSHYTPDEMHRERLLEFANPLFRDELYNYTSRPRRSILEVLLDFPSVKIPWQNAASVFPLLRHRQFSIASGGSLKTNPSAPDTTRIQLLVAIVKYQTILRKIRQGVCTRYLAGLQPGKCLAVTLTKGNMGSTADKPIVMIAPGTGLAPMRSLIWERNLLPSPPDATLFFGGRSARADFFYADEWAGTPDGGRALPVQVLTAFSRDQREKIYVQDVVRKESKLVFDVLKRGGAVYVCGSAGAMPKAVREALISVFVKEDSLEREGAEGKVAELEKEGRYKLEVW